jgi:phytoene dehydrogenase-like protein
VGNSGKKQCAVIGSGPNGLAAAVHMAQAGYEVTVYEAQGSPGGGCTTSEMTLPGFRHDHCSAIHPLGLGSPFYRALPLADFGLDWVQPDVALAHPLDNGTAVLLYRSIAETAAGLGRDSNSYRGLFGMITPLGKRWDTLCDVLMHPRKAILYPFELSRFGVLAMLSARELAGRYFIDQPAKALIAGIAAHSFLPLDKSPSAAFALVLGVLGHAVGWPIPRGGSQNIADSMIAYLHTLGGSVVTGQKIDSLGSFAPDTLIIADVNASRLPSLCGDSLTSGYKSQLQRFQPGPGIFKLDYALDSPVPWASRGCARAGTVHLGGTFDEIADSEAAVARGECPGAPFVLCAQQSLFDPTRAPSGKHTFWAYCHVPNGSTYDMTSAIEAQIERFAPGFSSRILARVATTPSDFESINPNFTGGDISGGAYSLGQILTRPTLSLNPWTVPLNNSRKLYLCSASTPPGGGVHGLCGYYAAQSALGRLWT